MLYGASDNQACEWLYTHFMLVFVALQMSYEFLLLQMKACPCLLAILYMQFGSQSNNFKKKKRNELNL